MEHLPVWLAIRGQNVLVAGGGRAAAAKARLAAQAGARVTLVAPWLGPDARELVASGAAAHKARTFEPGDAAGQVVVFGATGSVDGDRAVAQAARALDAPVNIVDRPALSTFLMPAIVDRGPVVVGVSTGGAAPALAARIRARIEAVLPRRLGALARFAESFRSAVKGRVPGGPARVRFWNRILDGPVGAAVLAGHDEQARESMMRILNGDQVTEAPRGMVHLVGAGPGDPELLTVRALRLVQEADVLVYDRLVGADVLEYARRDAERRYVGKEASAHSVPQSEINALLVERAQKGLKVVRLKGGDPFVFGRGGEEADALRAAGIAVEVVPGITSALGCAAAAGVPLTHRHRASAVTLVTGHGSDGGAEPDWAVLAALRHTLVVYMGVGQAAVIAGRLMNGGLPASTPVAVVERGTLSDQRVFAGSLAGLGDLVASNDVRPPALLIIGEVAAEAASGASAADRLLALAG